VVRSASVLLGATLALMALVMMPSAHAQTRPLNDTGQTSCYDATNAAVAVTQTNCGDGAARPRQDARYGRDAQAAAGTLSKIGAGAAGFDFTKIANNGSTLPASATLGGNPTDWACTKDNVTGLIWEVKTTSGLRSGAHLYSWYSTDGTANGGNVGAVGSDTCGGTLAAAPYNNRCNTQNFVAAVNAVGLCGASDWRLPTRKEVLSIMHSGRVNPALDGDYFPNTIASGPWGWFQWTSTNFSFGSGFTALAADVSSGATSSADKVIYLVVRLVRGGV